MERTHAALRGQLARERDAAARLEELLRPGGAAAAQEARGRAMERRLPARLPSLPPGALAAAAWSPPRVPRVPPMLKSLPPGWAKAAGRGNDDDDDDEDGDDGSDDDEDGGGDGGENESDADGGGRPPAAQTRLRRPEAPAPAPPPPPAPAPAPSAPRWYLTAAELAAAPSYMRGRLTLEKVNAAVNEAALLAESTARLMAAARAGTLARAVPSCPEERRRAAEMYHAAHSRPEFGLRGRFWFCDADLRGAGAGAALRADRSGKGLLQLLRHLGRVQEQRLSLECAGGACSAFVLLSGSGSGAVPAGARRRH